VEKIEKPIMSDEIIDLQYNNNPIKIKVKNLTLDERLTFG
jgi:hypothetical protein